MAVLEHVREQLPGDNLIIVSWGKDPRKVKKEQVEAGVEERTPKFFSVGGTIILDSDDDEEQPIATLVDESNGRARFETARTPAPVILPCLPSGAHGPRTKYVLVAIGLRGAAWEASVICGRGSSIQWKLARYSLCGRNVIQRIRDMGAPAVHWTSRPVRPYLKPPLLIHPYSVVRPGCPPSVAVCWAGSPDAQRGWRSPRH